ncbi:hypothetical protein [Thiomonas intermedia]|uniref:hypothetical protein n=1 Tax=Thiomonas intermedia TaxID=926 RepID=UPI0009A4CACA|nr:hypothetical protein [Thiomonas intermedia]
MFRVDWPAMLCACSVDRCLPIIAASCARAWTGRKRVQTSRPGGRALGDAFATGLLTAVTLHTLLH